MFSFLILNVLKDFIVLPCIPIATVRTQCIKDICQSNNSREKWDLLTASSTMDSTIVQTRITVAIPSFMVIQRNFASGFIKIWTPLSSDR